MPVQLWRCGLDKAVAILTEIINAMLRRRHFPLQWKCTDVVVLPKPDQARSLPQNYIRISLLPVVGKIAEGILLKKLQRAFNEVNVLQDQQFGFRARHSTVHHIFRVVEHITDGLNKRQSIGAIFLNVSIKIVDEGKNRGRAPRFAPVTGALRHLRERLPYGAQYETRTVRRRHCRPC